MPEFLQALDGQTISSYSTWLNGVEGCGFTQHAHVLLPTWISGDLHSRCRLIAIHTRSSQFHPAAALSRLLGPTSDETIKQPLASAEGGVFAFTSGLSVTRFNAKRGISACYSHFPAFNSNLNVIIYVGGSYWQLSPWLASRASALPDAWQVLKSRSSSKQASALANMVSPLQGRELGLSIAIEWRAPRDMMGVPACAEAMKAANEAASIVALRRRPIIPTEFACRHPRYGDASATLAFNSKATGRWHSVQNQRFKVLPPLAPFAELCQLAHTRKKLKRCTSLVDLQRAADDVSLCYMARQAAYNQIVCVHNEKVAAVAKAKAGQAVRKLAHYARMIRARQPGELRAVTLDEVFALVPDLVPHLAAVPDCWVECQLCQKWRRLLHRGRVKITGEWTCSQSVDIAFSSCDVPQELSLDEIDRRLGILRDSDELIDELDKIDGPPLEYESVALTLRGSGGIRGICSPVFWVECDNCHKWRCLPSESVHDVQMAEKWLCEQSPDPVRNSCASEEEAWDGTKATTAPSLPVHTNPIHSEPCRCTSMSSTHTVPAMPTPLATLTSPPIAPSPSTTNPFSDGQCLANLLDFSLPLSQGSMPRHHTTSLSDASSPDRRPTLPHASRKRSALRQALPSERRILSVKCEMLRANLIEVEAFESETKAEFEGAPLVLVAQVLKHVVYAGAAPGSLYNVYVKLLFSDGRSTGKHYVPSEPLARSEVLARYFDTTEGAKLRQYTAEADQQLFTARRAELDSIKASEAAAGGSAADATRVPRESTRVRRISGLDMGILCKRKLDALGTYLESRGGKSSRIAGWTVDIELRQSGNTSGQQDAYFFPPDRRHRFRSCAEVARYFGLEVARSVKPAEGGRQVESYGGLP